MALFGHYDTRSQLASTPNSSVYRARSTGEPGDNYVIKVFSSGGLQDSGESEELSDPGVAARLLDLFALQQKAAGESAHIAPILGSGKDFRGNAWYASRFYPRSLQKVIAGRVALNKEAFFYVFTSIVEGLQALKKTSGRSHGNLKPANVLISAGESIINSEVVIADAALGNEADREKLEIADLRAVGELIYQLVRRRELESTDDLFLPLLSSKEWTSIFGRQTKQWLAICNRLLDANLSLASYSLDQLERDLAALKPKKSIAIPVAGAVGALLVLSVVAAWFFLQKSNKRTLLITSDPMGATIAIDLDGYQPLSTPSDGKPLEIELPGDKSNFVVKAVYPGLSEQVTNIVVQEARAHEISFKFPYGSVWVTSEPTNAAVKIDNTQVGRTPCLVTYLKPVPITMQVDLAGHESTNATVMIGQGSKSSLHATLAKISEADGTVEFESDLGETVFQVENDAVDTPARFAKKALPPGNYKLSATIKEWGITKTTNVSVKAGDYVKASFVFGFARVEVSSSPQGARILEGTKEIGTTPLEKRFPAGKRTFTLELAGHESTNLVVNLTENQVLRTNVTLETSNGFLVLSSDPPGAEILTGGKVIGKADGTPIPVLPLPASHELVARYPGLPDKKTNLGVEKRKTKSFAFAFDYGTVTFETIPPNASIKLDGTNFLVGRPLPLKPLEFEISVPGYDPVITNVSMIKGARKLSVSLQVPSFQVTLQSDPDGAEIFDGTRSLGTVKSMNRLRAGTYNLTAKYKDLDPVTQSVTVTRTGAVPNLFQFQFATVTITSTPPGAEIFKDRIRLGTTPITNYFKPGRFAVDLVLNGVTNGLFTNLTADAASQVGFAFAPVRGNAFTNSVGMELVQVGDFYVGKFEVTHAQYESIMKTNPAPAHHKTIGPNMPIVGVNWTNAVDFCQLLTEADKALLAELGLTGFNYMIPAQEDWGKFAPFEPGDEAVFTGNDPQPINAERKSSNSYGLYDVYGNVAEMLVRADGLESYIGGAYNQKLNAGTPRRDTSLTTGTRNLGLRCVLKRP